MADTWNVSVEGIPFSDEDTFYRALIKGKYNKAGKPIPRAFDGPAVSVDWSKYANPSDTARRFRSTDPNLLPIKVAEITAQSIWDCLCHIRHDPLFIPGNYAHCLIDEDSLQPKSSTDKARVKLARAATIVYEQDSQSGLSQSS